MFCCASKKSAAALEAAVVYPPLRQRTAEYATICVLSLIYSEIRLMFHHLREDINSIIERDPAARNGWEVLTCYPGLHAIVMHGWAHWCWTRHMKWVGRFISYIARIITGIEIHPGAVIGRRVFIDHGFGVVIGETAIVGAGAQVLGNFTVGEYAKVGSNAVLLKPVPAGGTAVGNPAHIVQKDVNALREGSTAHLFAAYGVTPNGDDPLSKALQGLITHAVAQEQRIETILATLKAAGICCQAVPECDKFDSEQMNKLVD